MQRLISGAALAVLALILGGCVAEPPYKDEFATDYRVEIATREVWPVGVPIRARLEYRGPRFIESTTDVFAVPDIESGQTLRTSRHRAMDRVSHSSEWMYSDHTEEVCIARPGMHSIDFDTSVTTRRAGLLGLFGSAVRWRERIRVPITVVDSIDDAMTPVRSAEVLEAVENNFDLHIARHWSCYPGHEPTLRLPWYLRIDHREQLPHILDDVTIAVHAQLLRDGEEFAHAEGWWMQSRFRHPEGHDICMLDGHMSDYNSLKLVGDIALLDEFASGADGVWELRLTPLPEMALRNFESDRYWAGEITIPLRAKEVVISPKEDGKGSDWAWKTIR